MTLYPSIKYIHVTVVGLSLAGFVLRGLWRRSDPARLRSRWVRTLPHVNDTLLLASGATMLWLFGWSPFSQPWIAAKLTALVAYILLGAVALRAAAPGVRLGALIAAVMVFLYIVAVALTRQVWPLP